MANEISANLRFSLKNGNINDPGPNLGTFRINQNLAAIFKRTITLVAGVDTSISALIVGITTTGVAYLINDDPTNYFQWGGDSGGALVVVGRVTPNDFPAVWRIDPGATIRAKAHTGNVQCILCVYND